MSLMLDGTTATLQTQGASPTHYRHYPVSLSTHSPGQKQREWGSWQQALRGPPSALQHALHSSLHSSHSHWPAQRPAGPVRSLRQRQCLPHPALRHLQAAVGPPEGLTALQSHLQHPPATVAAAAGHQRSSVKLLVECHSAAVQPATAGEG
jgi:hypothetical protein